jgi:crossover junction endodeoxyribonuclease RuvC
MIVLGVDPGLSMCGWGIIDARSKNDIRVMSYGCIKTVPASKLPARLKVIHSNLVEIIGKFKPVIMAIEELFFTKEARTVAAVSQARGVILLTAEESGIPVVEYNPRDVKMALTGYGSADKRQIQEMVKVFLKLKEIPKPDDAADALAIAICHSNSSGSKYSELINQIK